MRDLRHAVRLLFRNPALAATIVLTLTLAIGAATAIYTVVHAVLLAPLPVPEPDRLVAVWETSPRADYAMRIASTHNVASWREASREVATFGVWRDWGFRWVTPEGPQPLVGAIASADLFRVLRVSPEAGRFFGPGEESPGRDTVVVLSSRAWRERFGADPSLIGRTITLSRSPEGPRPFTVIGVMPADVLPSMEGIEFWAPATLDPDLRQGRWLRNRRVIARLAPAATIEAARAELATIATALGREYPESNAGWGVALVPLADAELGSMRGPLAIFSGAIAFLLLIACANVAGLLVARASGRTREIGIRLALGASRRRVVRMLLAESLLLAGLGAAGGVLAAAWFVSLFKAYGPGLPRGAWIAVDGGALLFTAVTALIVGVLFGLAPAAQSAAIAPVESLKEGARSFLRVPGVRLRSVLVTVEIALALMLLVGAGLAIRSFAALLSTPLGVDPHNVLVFQVFPPAAKYAGPERLTAVYNEIGDRVRAVPGVTAVGAVSAGPMFGGRETVEFDIEGEAPRAAGDSPRARFFDANPDYFDAIGMRIVGGRGISRDDTSASTPVAVVNETFARTWFPEGAVGRRVRIAHDDRPALEIVGVVSDARQELTPGVGSEPEIYWPAAQYVRGAIYFVARTSIPPANVAPAIRATLLQIDRDVVPSRLTTMEQMIERTARRPRFDGLLLGTFAAFALLLASIGIYGLVSYAVGQRTREIGVRISLGAGSRDVLGLVLGQGLRAAAAGVVLGIAGAIALSRLLASLMPGVGAVDAVAIGAAAALLVLVTLLASVIPARRATRINPLVALKTE